MKVKIFAEYNEKLLEEVINDFIASDEHLFIEDIKFSSLVFKNHEDTIVKEYSAIVIYK